MAFDTHQWLNVPHDPTMPSGVFARGPFLVDDREGGEGELAVGSLLAEDDVQAREWSVFQRAVQPPSMRIVSPVMSEAAGEARNTTTPATSIGSPIRCRAAIRATTSARCAGSARYGSVPGGCPKGGAPGLGGIPCWPHWAAAHRVRVESGCL